MGNHTVVHDHHTMPRAIPQLAPRRKQIPRAVDKGTGERFLTHPRYQLTIIAAARKRRRFPPSTSREPPMAANHHRKEAAKISSTHFRVAVNLQQCIGAIAGGNGRDFPPFYPPKFSQMGADFARIKRIPKTRTVRSRQLTAVRASAFPE